MMSRRPNLAIIILLVILSCLAGRQAAEAVSQEVPPVAGVVIDYGNGSQTLALIPLTESDLTGLELLQATNLDLLTLGSGGWGVGICAIEQVGCDLSACRARLCQTSDPTSPYWQYLTAPDVPGETWRFNNRGASATIAEAGDVDAWFWLGTRPSTPALTVNEIADRLDVDLSAIGSEPVVRTFGAVPATTTPAPSLLGVVAGSGVVLATAAVGLIAIRRARTTVQ